MSTPTIIVIGASIMQVPAIQAAHQMGLKVAVVSPNVHEPGVALAEYHICVDLLQTRKVVTIVNEFHKKVFLSAVFTTGTDFSYVVACISDSLNLPGLNKKIVSFATNKDLMRERLASSGVAVPAWIVVKQLISELPNKLSFPVVVKPVDNMGSRGVQRVEVKSQLKNAVAIAFQNSKCGRVIIENFITGPEFSIDALVRNGVIDIYGVADRHIRFPPYFIEMGHTIPTKFIGNELQNVLQVFKDAVKAIGITNGAAKGDLKLSPNGPVVGEIAARLSGGYMSGWTYPLSSRVDLTRKALQIAMGKDPGFTASSVNRVVAERAFISIPGIVASVEGIARVSKIKEVDQVFLKVEPGSIVQFPTSNVEKSGNIIASSIERKKAIQAAEMAVQRILIRLRPNTETTERFLWSSSNQLSRENTFSPNEEIMNKLKSLPKMIGVFSERTGAPITRPVNIIKVLEISRVSGCDWHGMAFNNALKDTLQTGNAKLVSSECANVIALTEPVLGSVFWEAIIKAGVQGAIYVIDCFRQGILSGYDKSNYIVSLKEQTESKLL